MPKEKRRLDSGSSSGSLSAAVGAIQIRSRTPTPSSPAAASEKNLMKIFGAIVRDGENFFVPQKMMFACDGGTPRDVRSIRRTLAEMIDEGMTANPSLEVFKFNAEVEVEKKITKVGGIHKSYKKKTFATAKRRRL
jgi:hypothetical protein